MKNNLYLLAMLTGILFSCGTSGEQEASTETDSLTVDISSMSEEQIDSMAKEIHERVITLDTHDDINTANFTTETNYTQDLNTQVNLPKMREGGLDVAWFIVYTGQADLTAEGYAAAYENAMDKFSAIQRLCEEIAPDQIGMARTSQEVKELVKEGKLVAMIGVENAYPIGEDLSNIKKFYDMGARYMSMAHNGHSQLSDSNTGERDSVWLHNGLSDMGKEAIKEMNKWGIMIDLSHPSKEANIQTLQLTKAPVIASHSSVRALSDHPRNLDDEVLKMIAENGGVVQTVALATYVNQEKNQAYSEAERAIIEEIATEQGFEMKERSEVREMSTEDRDAYIAKYMEIRELAKPKMEASGAESVNVSDFVDHIDYMVNLMGIEHVGISSDFDGGGGIEGWSDASETYNVTLELVKRGYTEEQIGMLWSGNLLRVLDEVQAAAQNIQSAETAE